MKKQIFITFHGTRIARNAILTAALTALLPGAMCRGAESAPEATPTPIYHPPDADKSDMGSSVSGEPRRTPPPLIYHPPAAGDDDMGTNVSGEARGAGVPHVSLVAMVPNTLALTTHEQPSLFWFQSKPANATLEIALIEPGKAKPLMVVQSRTTKPGIHRIRLANHGVKLAPNVKYKWSVSLISDPSNRSLDVVVNGTFKRIEPSKKLTEQLAAAKPAGLPALYAQAGIWYDALEAISDEIDAHPGDGALRKERADLLKQIGLPDVEK